MALFGIVHALLGVVFGFPEMRARLHVDLASEGNLFLLLFLGVGTAYVTGGLLVDRFGNKPVLTAALLLYAFSLVLFSRAHSVYLAMPATFLLGMGGGGVSLSNMALVAEIYEAQRGPMLVAINAAMSLGSLSFTFGAAALVGKLAFPYLVLFVGAVALVHCGFCLLLKFPEPKEAHGFSVTAAIHVLRYPGVFLFALLLFVEASNEISLVGWTPTWMGDLGASPRYATASLGLLQTSMLVGRILGFPVLKRVPQALMITACAVGAVFGGALMWSSHTAGAMTTGIVVVGLTLAVIYPSTLGMARDHYQHFAGTLMGTMMASGVLGSMFGPWLVGHMPARMPIHSRLVVPVAGTVVFCGLMLLLLRRNARERAASATTVANATTS
jgi:MFS family permease